MRETFNKVLITGGAGMLAHALVATLSRRDVQPIVRSRADLDITQPNTVSQIWELGPSLILNCAAFTKVDLCEVESETCTLVNATAPSILAQCAMRIGAKLVHFSTDFVFNGKANKPYAPHDAVFPILAYGASKAIGERALKRRLTVP